MSLFTKIKPLNIKDSLIFCADLREILLCVILYQMWIDFTRHDVPQVGNRQKFRIQTFSGFFKFYQTVDSLMILWCHSFCSGSFINYVDMAWGRGVYILLHKPYLAKWSTRRERGSKMSKKNCPPGLYGWPFLLNYHFLMFQVYTKSQFRCSSESPFRLQTVYLRFLR